MLPRSRIFSILLLGLGVAMVVWGVVAPRFIFSDPRLPLNLENTTLTLEDDAATTVVPSGEIKVPLTHQLHYEIVEPVDAESATIRVGESLMRSSNQAEQDRLIRASVSSYRIDRTTGQIDSEVAVTENLASPTYRYEIDGVWLKFPSNSEQTTYQVLDPMLRQTRPAEFVDSSIREGREIMHYRQVISRENLASLYASPTNTVQISAPEGPVKGFLFHNATRDFWVDRTTGLLVNVAEKIDDFYGSWEGKKLQQVLLFDATLPQSQSDELFAQAAGISDGSVLRWLSWAAIVTGVVAIVVGIAGASGVVTFRRRKAH